MGLGKKANLILPPPSAPPWSSPDFKRDGARVHFDLEGYDILFWDPADLDTFRNALTERIRRRLAVVARRPVDAAAAVGSDLAWRDDCVRAPSPDSPAWTARATSN